MPLDLKKMPILVIEQQRGWRSIDFNELWRYRELLYFLTWRDVKVRYKQTVLGAAWALLQPLMAMLIFTVIFGRVVRVPSDGIPYTLFVYSGILPWIYFSNSLVNSGNSLVQNSTLVGKVFFPRMMVPLSTVLAGLIDFAIGFVFLLFLMAGQGYVPPLSTVLVIPLMGIFLLLAFGLGLWFSALNVRYRDVRHVIPFLVQIWMFATPIVYPLSIVPEKFQFLLYLNPATGVIEGIRSVLFGGPFAPWPLCTGVVLSLGLLVTGAYYFRRVESTFADMI